MLRILKIWNIYVLHYKLRKKWHNGKTRPRTLRGPRTLAESRTLCGPRALWGLRTLWGLRILWWPRKDLGTYKLAKFCWFPHHVFNLVELTIKDQFIYSLLNTNKLKTFCKTKNVLEIKREQLWILFILVHVKTGVVIVTCN